MEKVAANNMSSHPITIIFDAHITGEVDYSYIPILCSIEKLTDNADIVSFKSLNESRKGWGKRWNKRDSRLK